MKKSKRANASKLKDEVDLISNLPDDLLHLILSRLPTTEEVVRTSILSRRWRYLNTSFSYSSLDIDFSRTLKSPTRFEMNKFREFMNRVLVNKSTDLDSFRLYCWNYHNMWTIGRWIDAAVTRNVNLIHLMVCPKKEFKVPHCLITSDSLEVLKLNLFGSVLRLPNFTALPALRVLELNSVALLDAEFLKSCPLLEDLRLIDCWMNEFTNVSISCLKLKNLRIDNPELDQGLHGSLDISCPKLERLEFAGYVHRLYILGNIDSLKKVVIQPELFRRETLSVAAMSHPGLSLRINFEHEYLHPVRVLPPNLKTLEVATTIDFLTKDALIHFLEGFPDMESLHLIIIEGPFWPSFYSHLDEDRMRMLTENLKRVDFVDFNGEKEKLFVARALLEHGDVLEEMVFSWGNETTYNERSMETMKEVSDFHKASSTVKLISRLKN